MKNFFLAMVQDSNGDISSKRTITFLSFLCCAIAFLCNVFIEIKLEENIFDGMLFLTASGLGFTTMERFSPNKKKKEDT
jgi:hypothetical protein